jgi:hypothetical protein
LVTWNEVRNRNIRNKVLSVEMGAYGCAHE